MTSCVLVLWRLFALTGFVVAFLLRVEHLVSMHDPRALVEVRESFFVFAKEYVHNSPVEVEVFSVEDVFLVVVRFVFVFLLNSVIFAEISTLSCIRSCLKLSVETTEFIGVKFTQVFEFILFFFFLLLLDTESEIVFLHFSFLNKSILLFAPA